jgi:hypothetical protein
MLYNCFSLFSVNDISKWDTSNIKNISNIFNNSSSLLDVLSDKSKWKINNNSYISLSKNKDFSN